MLVILSGVSGAGKDTIKKELIKRMENVISLPSFTSRKPRNGEKEGVQYHFITKEQFKEKINNGEFYEYDLHQVKDIEVNGTENLIKMLSNDTKIVTIFLKVNKEELKHRLINRGDNLSEKEIQLRLDRLEYEESKLGLYDYVLKNDDLEKTVQIIMTIIANEKRLENEN